MNHTYEPNEPAILEPEPNPNTLVVTDAEPNSPTTRTEPNYTAMNVF